MSCRQHGVSKAGEYSSNEAAEGGEQLRGVSWRSGVAAAMAVADDIIVVALTTWLTVTHLLSA